MSKRIYLASPFFDEFELDCVRRAEDILTKRVFELFSPRLNEVERDKAEEPGLTATAERRGNAVTRTRRACRSWSSTSERTRIQI